MLTDDIAQMLDLKTVPDPPGIPAHGIESIYMIYVILD